MFPVKVPPNRAVLICDQSFTLSFASTPICFRLREMTCATEIQSVEAEPTPIVKLMGLPLLSTRMPSEPFGYPDSSSSLLAAATSSFVQVHLSATCGSSHDL